MHYLCKTETLQQERGASESSSTPVGSAQGDRFPVSGQLTREDKPELALLLPEGCRVFPLKLRSAAPLVSRRARVPYAFDAAGADSS